MTTDRVMLLIDADNVSVDVIDQAVRLLMKQHGALHVRRAYCTAEGALKHQAAFKRLGIKPMVNLSAGKNSTDIALAVDAIDLVLAERPDVVAIASSDSDFAPLVQRLREKGCVVRGIGQQGKVGDETQDVYDDYTVLEHRKPAGSTPANTTADRPTRTSSRAPARKAAVKRTTKPAAASGGQAEPGPLADQTGGDALESRSAVDTPPPTQAPARKAPARTARKTAGKVASRTAASAAAQVVDEADSSPPVSAPPVTLAAARAIAETVSEIVAAKPGPAATPARARPSEPSLHETARKILECMPELNRGDKLELRVASQRLREAGLLSKSGTSTRLLGKFPELFELVPPGQPNHLRLRR